MNVLTKVKENARVISVVRELDKMLMATVLSLCVVSGLWASMCAISVLYTSGLTETIKGFLTAIGV